MTMGGHSGITLSGSGLRGGGALDPCLGIGVPLTLNLTLFRTKNLKYMYLPCVGQHPLRNDPVYDKGQNAYLFYTILKCFNNWQMSLI